MSATSPLIGDDDEADGYEAPAVAGSTVIVTGRYAKAGPVRLALDGRDSNESFKPLLNLSFTLPDGAAYNQEVRREWARQQDQTPWLRFNTAGAPAGPSGQSWSPMYWRLA